LIFADAPSEFNSVDLSWSSIFVCLGLAFWRRRVSPYEPSVEFLWVRDVVLVRYDGVNQPFSSLYAFAAFIRQEASLSWTVYASLAVLAESSQKIV